MPNTTPNLGLIKPLVTEQYDIAKVTNENADILDTEIQAIVGNRIYTQQNVVSNGQSITDSINELDKKAKLDTYVSVSNDTFSPTTASLEQWYMATGWTITVPSGKYQVDLHTILDGNLTSSGIAIPVVQLGTSSSAGTNLIGFASVGNILNFSNIPNSWGNVFASQVFEFATETTIYVNYQMLSISGTPTIEALRLRNSFPTYNGLLRATRIA